MNATKVKQVFDISQHSFNEFIFQAEVECLYNQDFRALHDECIANGTLFEDPEFPPDNDLLRLRSKRIEDDVEWMRPSEYLELAKDLDEDTPILVSERNEGFDIKV